MISKITSILTVGVAALVLAAPANLLALNAKQQKASTASLLRQLNALPKHKAPSFAKINSLVKQLATQDPKKAASYLKIGLDKIAISNAKKNATTLTNTSNAAVNKSKLLKPTQKKSIVNASKNLLKKYVAPGPKNPPYQAMLSVNEVAA